MLGDNSKKTVKNKKLYKFLLNRCLCFFLVFKKYWFFKISYWNVIGFIPLTKITILSLINSNNQNLQKYFVIMKNIIFILTLSLSFILNAQVGINTINPKSTLDIRATNQATPNSKDGVLLTKIDMFPVSNPGIDQNSMLVYLTTDLTNINISGTPQDYTKGFYY